MSTKNNEPNRLNRGKEFHKKIQKEWLNNAKGDVTPEKSTTKPNGRKGRMDIFVKSDGTLVAMAEIKVSDWDAMTLATVRRNVNRQALQIWDYIQSQLELGRGISPGIIFSKKLKDFNRLNLIEQLFDREGILVV